MHLVVKRTEAEVRFALRLSIQFDLKFPYFIRRFQTLVNPLFLPFFSNIPEARLCPP